MNNIINNQKHDININRIHTECTEYKDVPWQTKGTGLTRYIMYAIITYIQIHTNTPSTCLLSSRTESKADQRLKRDKTVLPHSSLWPCFSVNTQTNSPGILIYS